ncbi:MAG: siroheme synthase CysG [Candidatus Kryptoniota bacterium]
MNRLYPIFLKIENRPVLIIGGGKAAEQKIKGLLEANAEVSVIAPEITSWLEELASEKKIHLERRQYKHGDVDGFILVVGATNDRDVQEKMFDEAQAKGTPVNIVDVPELCTFYLSSVFQEGDLKVAVSTNGKSPTLGKIIRDKIMDEFSKGYPELLQRLGEIRPDVRSTFPDFENRKRLHEQIVRSELKRLKIGARMPDSGVRNPVPSFREPSQVGKVFLVGAGPGDPELITVKGLRILRSAEVVLYDALVNEELLEEVPESAENIFVGKRARIESATPLQQNCVRQEKINELLIAKAQERKRVVRLKGGDPFIFGRGAEELEALHDAGIEVEVVPGITAGIGVPTSLGIPLTHRKESSSVMFVTGHKDSAKDEESLDWENLSRADTVVIYMGVKRLSSIIDGALRNGVPSSRPVAVIFGGTSAEEKVITGKLGNIEDVIKDIATDLPGLIVIGDVVGFFGGHKCPRSVDNNPDEVQISSAEIF